MEATLWAGLTQVKWITTDTTCREGVRAMMKNPPHPGRTVRDEILEPFGLAVGQAADALGVSRPHLSNLFNAKAGITPEMAIRLGKALGNDPDFWLRLQRQYDLAQALKTAHTIHVGRLGAA